MVVVMTSEATTEELDAVVRTVEAAGGSAFVSRGVHRTIVGLVGDVEQFETLNLDALPGVGNVVRISSAYKLVSRENHPDTSTVFVAGVPIGPDTFTLIAGPCAVETPEQTMAAAQMAKSAGASLLRGGAFKPRTSPYAFQGLGEAGLKILAEARAETGLPIVTEVVDAQDVDLVSEYADMLQIGTRNMQNFALLQAAGSAGKPVMLKRGMNATIEEWLMAAEYIAQRGNLDIVLCERGIRTFETVLPQHARHQRGAAGALVVAPAGHGRPVACRRAARAGRAAGPRGDRGGSGRGHGRPASGAWRGAVRRPAGPRRRRPAGARDRGPRPPPDCSAAALVHARLS